MALGVAVKDSRATNTNMNIAPVSDSQFSRKRYSSNIVGNRSHRSNTDSTIDSPVQHGFKSVQTLGDHSVDVFPMVSRILNCPSDIHLLTTDHERHRYLTMVPRLFERHDATIFWSCYVLYIYCPRSRCVVIGCTY
jgi:hypothetical protein